jgi:sortase (surface protein transpeptidase)
MRTLLDRLVTRFVPAVLTAAGVTLLGAGLLTYTNGVAADVGASASPSAAPSAAIVSPTPSPSPNPSPSPDPSAALSPSGTGAVSTRVVIPALHIDLPVIKPPNDAYPLCNVAMYIQELKQPGEDGATYLYAHARTGMFLPLLTEAQKNGGKRMLGMLVQVYTSDDRLHLYEITEVRPVVPFATALDDALAATTDQLWLQTSIGPAGTKPKMQVVAMPLTTGPADHAAAHPVPKPVACG